MDKILTVLSSCSIFIPLLFGILWYSKIVKDLRIVVIFLGFEAFFQISSATMVLMGYKNLWTIHFYTIIEYIFLIAIFSQWQKILFIRRLMFVTIPIIITIAIYELFLLENLNMFNIYSKPISSIFMFCILGLTLFELNKESNVPLLRNPRFWIIPPLTVTVIITISVFTVGNYLLRHFPSTFADIYRVILIVSMLSNFFYLGIFLCPSQQPKSGG